MNIATLTPDTIATLNRKDARQIARELNGGTIPSEIKDRTTALREFILANLPTPEPVQEDEVDGRAAKAFARRQSRLTGAVDHARQNGRVDADGVVTLLTVDLVAGGFSTCQTKYRTNWSPNNTGGKTARESGFQVHTAKDTDHPGQAGGFILILVPSDTPWERPVNTGDSVTRQAARARKVSPKMVTKFQNAVRGKGDGQVVLTARDLVMNGIGQNWATTTRAHLEDPTHVKARTLAAAGFTGLCVRGELVLTPITEVQVAVA